MWTQVSGGYVTRVITSPISLTIDNITHPSSIFTKWTAIELRNIGIYPYSEESADHRYHYSGNVTYTVLDDKVIGSYAQTDKDVAELKKGMITRTRQAASNILARDDWMSIREAEGGTAIPTNIKTYRAAIRTESGTKEDEINALSDLDAVKLYEATPYTIVQKDGNEDGTYGPGTHTYTADMNLITHYESVDPLAEENPALVSLTKD